MDPQAQFCQNPECAARGKRGEGNIRVHSHKEHRYRCSRCGKTFTKTKGTALYRLHKPLELYFIVLTLLSHGCPPQAIVAAYGVDERTVADWAAKAGKHCEQVHKHLVKAVAVGCVQADELWVKMVGRKVWMAMAVAVSSRLWLAGAVSVHRDRILVGTLARMVRAAAKSADVLVLTDGFRGYVTAFRRVWRVPMYTGKRGRPRLVEEQGLLMGQAVKQYAKRRVIGVVHRVAVGTQQAVERALEATGCRVINTAYIERLNATFRARLAPLVRRTRGLARKSERLQAGMWLVGCCYNWCWAHHSLKVAGDGGGKWMERTPAMAAGLTNHIWSLEELLSYKLPLPEYLAPKRRGHPPKQPAEPSLRLAA